MKWLLFYSTMCRVVHYTALGNQNSPHIHIAHYLMIIFLKHQVAYIFTMTKSIKCFPTEYGINNCMISRLAFKIPHSFEFSYLIFHFNLLPIFHSYLTR